MGGDRAESFRVVSGEKAKALTHIPFTEEFRDDFQIGIGITDPDEEETLELAMDAGLKDGIQVIYTYEE